MKSGDLSRADIKRIVASLMTTLLLAALGSTIVGTAMPRIISDLHGIEHYSWPFAAYTLVGGDLCPDRSRSGEADLLPPAGRAVV
jgi:hypothetical protein